ncbi:unnamed protein product [Cyprideis torosa]|uniref:Uncharacterized protein n=1 Tax=Cyprideis torosa TaxID=163714 RepID=A0A7R8ZN57_9CRUS|nr:unnamed protein product [Cyprideis torosa]CAG0895429.1 unnamed protein product [Cyprideis torosa]
MSKTVTGIQAKSGEPLDSSTSHDEEWQEFCEEWQTYCAKHKETGLPDLRTFCKDWEIDIEVAQAELQQTGDDAKERRYESTCSPPAAGVWAACRWAEMSRWWRQVNKNAENDVKLKDEKDFKHVEKVAESTESGKSEVYLGSKREEIEALKEDKQQVERIEIGVEKSCRKGKRPKDQLEEEGEKAEEVKGTKGTSKEQQKKGPKDKGNKGKEIKKGSAAAQGRAEAGGNDSTVLETRKPVPTREGSKVGSSSSRSLKGFLATSNTGGSNNEGRKPNALIQMAATTSQRRGLTERQRRYSERIGATAITLPRKRFENQRFAELEPCAACGNQDPCELFAPTPTSMGDLNTEEDSLNCLNNAAYPEEWDSEDLDSFFGKPFQEKEEIAVAVDFFTAVVPPHIHPRRVYDFRVHLSFILHWAFADVWDPEEPAWGQGYRVIRLNFSHSNMYLEYACQKAKFSSCELRLPAETTLWIDPGEVCVRYGENNGVMIALYDEGNRLNEDAFPVNLDVCNENTWGCEVRNALRANRRALILPLRRKFELEHDNMTFSDLQGYEMGVGINRQIDLGVCATGTTLMAASADEDGGVEEIEICSTSCYAVSGSASCPSGEGGVQAAAERVVEDVMDWSKLVALTSDGYIYYPHMTLKEGKREQLRHDDPQTTSIATSPSEDGMDEAKTLQHYDGVKFNGTVYYGVTPPTVDSCSAEASSHSTSTESEASQNPPSTSEAPSEENRTVLQGKTSPRETTTTSTVWSQRARITGGYSEASTVTRKKSYSSKSTPQHVHHSQRVYQKSTRDTPESAKKGSGNRKHRRVRRSRGGRCDRKCLTNAVGTKGPFGGTKITITIGGEEGGGVVRVSEHKDNRRMIGGGRKTGGPSVTTTPREETEENRERDDESTNSTAKKEEQNTEEKLEPKGS